MDDGAADIIHSITSYLYLLEGNTSQWLRARRVDKKNTKI
jgi:hypothetical protein